MDRSGLSADSPCRHGETSLRLYDMGLPESQRLLDADTSRARWTFCFRQTSAKDRGASGDCYHELSGRPDRRPELAKGPKPEKGDAAGGGAKALLAGRTTPTHKSSHSKV